MLCGVALGAAAAGTAGPTYWEASRPSILADTAAAAPSSGRGFEVVQTGSGAALLTSLGPEVHGELAGDLGGQATTDRLFAPPIMALEMTVVSAAQQTEIPLVWRSGECAHLRLRGRCPSARHQVIISPSLARSSGWRARPPVPLTPLGALTVTGVYEPPPASTDYLFGRRRAAFPY